MISPSVLLTISLHLYNLSNIAENILQPDLGLKKTSCVNFVTLSCRMIKSLLPKFIRGPKGPESKMATRLKVG